jgi:hypothetical protein
MDTAARLHRPNFRSATHKPLLRIRGIFSHQYKLIAASSFQRTTNWAQCQCRSDPAIGRPSIGAVAMVHGSCRLRWRGGSWVQHNRSGRSARIAFCSLLIGKLQTQRATVRHLICATLHFASRSGRSKEHACTIELSQGHYYATVFGNRVVGGLINAQVRHDRFRGSMSQPFGKGKVLKTIDLSEHLQEHQIGVAYVIDVM